MRQFNKIVKQLLLRQGYRISRIDDLDQFLPLLYYVYARSKDLYIVQIGANDGKMLDPIYDFIVSHHKHVRGVVIEPLRDFYDDLARNYAKYPSIVPLNLAIHETQKEMVLWRIDPAKHDLVEPWARGLASFDKMHHLRLRIPTEYMISETVRCISFEELLDRQHIASVDLLQIDTEGYDAEIILGLPFKRIQPSLIHFEHGLQEGTMSSDVFNKVADHLHEQGYELAIGRHDATAYRRSLFVKATLEKGS